MDPSLYGDLVQLEYLIASEKPAAHCVTTKSSKEGAPFVAGLYQEEESVDFSALVEACELNSSSPHLTTSSATFLDPSDSAFPFEADLLPTATSTASLSMFSAENGSNNTTLDLLAAGSLTTSSVTQSSSIALEMLPTSTTEGTTTGNVSPKCGSKRKLAEKGSHEYREKRDRNNLAVKKSRSKSKMKIRETEDRVKELEDENSRLQNKIALLSKELNVLKSLFSSAGVPQPATMNTLDSSTE